MADPYCLPDPAVEVAIDGATYRARGLTLAARERVNAVLRKLYPHPLVEANRHLAEAGITDPEERKLVVQNAIDRWNQAGWPLTLDSSVGRTAAYAHAEAFAAIVQGSLERDHPEITADSAHRLALRMGFAAQKRVIEAAFDMRMGTLDVLQAIGQGVEAPGYATGAEADDSDPKARTAAIPTTGTSGSAGPSSPPATPPSAT